MKRFLSMFAAFTLTIATAMALTFWSLQPTRFAEAHEPRQLHRAVTHDFASLIDGAGESATVTGVTGARLGDFCAASLGVSTVGVIMTCNVTASNVAIVRAQNETAGVVDLASTTLRVTVFKQAPF